MGLSLGVTLAATLRWDPRHRRSRAFFVPLGLNLAALALVATILVSGMEDGGMGTRWTSWLLPFGLATGLSTLALRFPWAAGLPMLALAAMLSWQVATALVDFRPMTASGPVKTVQPMTDRETVTAFALQADVLTVSTVWGGKQQWYRLRETSAPPTEWWWGWAASQGWAHSSRAAIPEKPFKYGVYRLSLSGGYPQWLLEKPELAPPP